MQVCNQSKGCDPGRKDPLCAAPAPGPASNQLCGSDSGVHTGLDVLHCIGSTASARVLLDGCTGRRHAAQESIANRTAAWRRRAKLRPKPKDCFASPRRKVVFALTHSTCASRSKCLPYARTLAGGCSVRCASRLHALPWPFLRLDDGLLVALLHLGPHVFPPAPPPFGLPQYPSPPARSTAAPRLDIAHFIASSHRS
jgi:hypothetical protein